jgi:3-methylcrotonyl-CoA carboxylase alpha subunit
MAYRLQVDGREVEAQIVARRPELGVRIGAVRHRVCVQHDAADEFALSVDGVGYRGWRCRVGDEVHVRLEGRTYVVRLVGHESKAASAEALDEIRASMPGVVVAVQCESGQAVKTGDKLLTLESMKLQMTIVALRDATVQQVHVTPAAVFERGALLVSLVPEESRES